MSKVNKCCNCKHYDTEQCKYWNEPGHFSCRDACEKFETRLHCWTGKTEWLEEKYGWGTTEYWENWAESQGKTCMLSDGHKGPHEWTNDNEIMVTFK